MRYGSMVMGIVAILALTLVVAEDSSAATCDDIKIYVECPDGSYEKSVVNGVSTVKEAIDATMADQGKKMELNSRGNVRSVDGLEGDDDHVWRIHQWLPLGTSGWGLMAFNDKSDSMMVTGASYCLHISTMSNKDGTTVYSSPDFMPEAEGYIFIRFANGFSPDVPEVLETFTADVRQEGFWLKGYGSTMAEVLKDAVNSNGFVIELANRIDENGNNLQGWIIKMFGLGDVLIEGNTWSYWSQWMWVDHSWQYNDWTLGYYDPAVYRYAECIYLISTPDPYGSGYNIDKGGPEPNPDTDEITFITSYPVVTFSLEDGTVVNTQYLKYGETPDMTIVPEPAAPEGMVFAGRGNTSVPIVSDTDFVAKFVGTASCMVRYFDETKTAVLYAEAVPSGSPSVYKGEIPFKAPTDQYTYEFTGWSEDLSKVIKDTDVTPVFKAAPKSHDHVWDAGAVTKAATCKEEGTRTYTCTVCGETRTEPVPKTDHVWSSWQVVKEPTADQSGKEARTCSVCNETEEREIPATGSGTNMLLVAGIAIVGILFIATGAYVLLRKR